MSTYNISGGNVSNKLYIDYEGISFTDVSNNNFVAMTPGAHYGNTSMRCVVTPDMIVMGDGTLAIHYKPNGIETFEGHVLDITTTNGLTLQNVPSTTGQLIKADINGNPYWADSELDGLTDLTTTNGLTLQHIPSTIGQVIKADISGNPYWADGGIDGLTGVTGVTGVIGITGVTGVNGTNGITGVTGVNGTNGITGVTGVNGTNGITGVIGLTGTTGVTGVTGITGLTGPLGPSGSIGLTGAIGPSIWVREATDILNMSTYRIEKESNNNILLLDYNRLVFLDISNNNFLQIEPISNPLDNKTNTACFITHDMISIANSSQKMKYKIDGIDAGGTRAFDIKTSNGLKLQGGSSTIGQIIKADISGNPYWADGGSGVTGLTGATGATGPMGLSGATGPMGFIGETGSSGPIGLTGASGPSYWISTATSDLNMSYNNITNVTNMNVYGVATLGNNTIYGKLGFDVVMNLTENKNINGALINIEFIYWVRAQSGGLNYTVFLPTTTFIGQRIIIRNEATSYFIISADSTNMIFGSGPTPTQTISIQSYSVQRLFCAYNVSGSIIWLTI